MNLRPSDIRFTQNNINNVFDRKSSHRHVPIGKTLDLILKGHCRISDIPTITVKKKDGLWFTKDNRRLWVFRKLEELGNCTEIPVQIGSGTISSKKLTTSNEGVSVEVRGDPGGSYWQQCSNTSQRQDAQVCSSSSRTKLIFSTLKLHSYAFSALTGNSER